LPAVGDDSLKDLFLAAVPVEQRIVYFLIGMHRISGRIPDTDNSRRSGQIDNITISVHKVSKSLLETVAAFMLSKGKENQCSDVFVYFLPYLTRML
jgi:hypothetical protein